MTTRMPSRLTFWKPASSKVDVVDARRQREEAVVAVGAGDLHLRLNQRRAGGGDGDARQHRAGVVGDGAVDTAAEILCGGGGDHRDEQSEADHDAPWQCCHASSKTKTRNAGAGLGAPGYPSGANQTDLRHRNTNTDGVQDRVPEWHGLYCAWVPQ